MRNDERRAVRLRKMAKARKLAEAGGGAGTLGAGILGVCGELDPVDIELQFPEVVPEEYMVGAECETIDKVKPIIRASGFYFYLHVL